MERDHGLFFVVRVSVPVLAKALGTSWPIAVGSSNAGLLLPRSPGRFEAFSELLQPDVPLEQRWLDWWRGPADRDEHHRYWGSGYAGNAAGELTAAWLRRAVVWCPVADMPASEEDQRTLGDGLAAAIDDWLERVVAWCEVVGGIVLGDRRHRESSQSPAHVFPLPVQVSETGQTHFPSLSQISRVWAESRCLTVDGWAAAVDLVNRRQEPTAEHLLIGDARAAMSRGDMRAAVFDLATASEIVLLARVQQTLEGRLGADGARAVLGNRSPGGPRLLDLAAGLGLDIPPKVRLKVFDPRDAAIHRNEPVPVETARESLAAAENLLRLHAPLPLPDGCVPMEQLQW